MLHGFRRGIAVGLALVHVRALARSVLLLGVFATLGSCADYEPTQVPPLPDKAAAPDLYRPTPEAKYTIANGDKLSVSSYFHPALKQSVTVQPDGKVPLLLVGTRMAAGKSPDELAKELVRLYDKYVENAEITVAVDDSAALMVYVGGEVAKPTTMPIKGELTLLQGVTNAGGFLSTANKEQVLVVRQNPDGGFKTLQANAEQVLHNQADEIYLRQHDIVFVPKSAIARVDQFVDQYLNQVVPRWVYTSFGFNYAINGISASSTIINSSNTTNLR